MAARSALQATTDGILLDVDVSPGARDAAFPAGYNPWRERVEARVRSPPRDGEANAELVELVARFFDVDPRAVAVVRGAKGRRKTLRLHGVSLDDATRKLDGTPP